MNATRQEIGADYADAALEIAMELGELITISNRGGSPLRVYCLPEGESDASMVEMAGAAVRERTRVFEIPTQTTAETGYDNFPPTGGPMSWEVITDEYGDLWRIQNTPNRDGLRAIWTMTGVCTTPKRSGQVQP